MNSKDDDNDNDIAWWFDAAMAKDNYSTTQEKGHLIPRMPFDEVAVMTTKLPKHMLQWWLSYNQDNNNNKSGSSSSNRRKK